MKTTLPTTLTTDRILQAIKDLDSQNLEITHQSIRNQILSSGFHPTTEDLAVEVSGTFVWLRAISQALKQFRSEGLIIIRRDGGSRKGAKYELIKPKPEAVAEKKPRQIDLAEFSEAATLSQIATDLAEIKDLLRALVDRLSPPTLKTNGNGRSAVSGNGAGDRL